MGDLPHGHWIVEVLERQGAERAAFEKSADEPAGVTVDDHRFWFGQRLKSHREIGRLADHFAFVRRIISYTVADNHQTGGDADPHLQGGSDPGSSFALAPTNASAARTARSASCSRACGWPK